MTLLETGFPFRDVSRLVAADRRAPDPAYQAHRWWARRPPSLLRAALLAATCPETTSSAEFWRLYRSEDPHLDGVVVRDPFLGGGTTLVEAVRLGASVTGADVDPLAVTISEHQLDPPRPEDLLAAASRLLEHLRLQLGGLWPGATDVAGGRWTPLHYFYVTEVTCGGCATVGPLYRSLVIARSVGRQGAVVREHAVTAFCPACYGLHHLESDATDFTCCGRSHSLTAATFNVRYTCPACDVRSSHEQLQTGVAPKVLIAVEETPAGRRTGGRRIRAPRPADRAGATKAANRVAAAGIRETRSVPLVPGASDGRPLSFGMSTVESLHTDRQLLYLTEAFKWIDAAGLPDQVARALRLAVSTTITCNNRLCGYATDYGRLAPLFSVRAFSLPWLTVELNPLHPNGGRGSLLNAVHRVAGSCRDEVRRHVVGGRRHVEAVTLSLPRPHRQHRLEVADSTSGVATGEGPLADVCITDPPYFDFIPYDTLSQVFRLWLAEAGLAGQPLHPVGEDRVVEFGKSLGVALRSAMKGCKPDALLAFTYKGDEQAWEAVGVALDEAKMRVTALWPVLADPHMGHHSHEGNCEYDVLVVARPISFTSSGRASLNVDDMLKELRKDRSVSIADERNLRVAESMASARWGTLA